MPIPGPASNERSPAARIALPRGRLLLVGTGSFGVISLPTWVMTLRRACGWSIRVCLTRSAADLVAPAALAAASQHPVVGPQWTTTEGVVPHQELAKWADLVVVAPATTNFLSKLAHCMPDSLALSAVVSTAAPVVLAPALPDGALSRPSLHRVLDLLREDGYHLVPTQPSVSVHSGQPSHGGMADLGTVLRVAAEAVAASAEPAAEPGDDHVSGGTR